METESFSETALTVYQATRRHIPDISYQYIQAHHPVQHQST
jgi:hypothetical protein